MHALTSSPGKSRRVCEPVLAPERMWGTGLGTARGGLVFGKETDRDAIAGTQDSLMEP